LIKLAIFVSGGGSNANEIIHYFKKHADIQVALIVCNNPNAGALKIAENQGVPAIVFSKEDFYKNSTLFEALQRNAIDMIILAGFLWLIPGKLVQQYQNRILNIHPSLLPKYGGKGMYGHYVHEAVKADNAKETGVTIHLVNEKYDDGSVLFQKKCKILPEMQAEEIAALVLKLEHKYFSPVIEKYALEYFNRHK